MNKSVRIYANILGATSLVFLTNVTIPIFLFKVASYYDLSTANANTPSQPDVEIPFWYVSLFGPLFETVVLTGLLNILIRLRFKTNFASLTAALFFSFLHAAENSVAGFTSLIGFFVFSKMYFLGHPIGFLIGFAYALIPHSVSNILIFALKSMS